MLETKTAPYTFVKLGIYYFSRRVPSDLSHHYTADRISYSLRTKSAVVARSRAMRAGQQLDEHWYHLRIRETEVPGMHLLRRQSHPASGSTVVRSDNTEAAVSLSEAVSIYLRLKGQGRPVTFQRAAERSCGYVIDVCGDKDITSYTKSDANAFRDDLIKRGLAGSSITRVFGTVRSVINFAASEVGVEMTNPFGNVYYDRNAGVSSRAPLPIDAIRSIQGECRKLDDDLRWLIAMASDTGMRLAEVAGLLKSDLKLDGPVPHIVVQEHPWRRLKTSGSARKVPLVGTALWAARRVHESVSDSDFAFPRYCSPNKTNANSASAALNKWMKPQVPQKCTMHSFRHSMRDRLRAVECPADIVDQIGGWETEGVGHSYGDGYPFEILFKWMEAAT
ncbi:integrase [Jannaschia sp. EhC01]|nr:integrase [Jannaschia sp. EhC01]